VEEIINNLQPQDATELEDVATLLRAQFESTNIPTTETSQQNTAQHRIGKFY
jgi:hypothetical protein